MRLNTAAMMPLLAGLNVKRSHPSKAKRPTFPSHPRQMGAQYERAREVHRFVTAHGGNSHIHNSGFCVGWLRPFPSYSRISRMGTAAMKTSFQDDFDREVERQAREEWEAEIDRLTDDARHSYYQWVREQTIRECADAAHKATQRYDYAYSSYVRHSVLALLTNKGEQR